MTNTHHMIQYIPWDSEHFGLKVGNLIINRDLSSSDVADAIAKAKSEQYELLYLKGHHVDKELLSSDFLLADEKVIYQLQITNHQSYLPDSHVVSWLHRPLDAQILSLALQSGEYSRYYWDKNMPQHVFQVLYKTWIERSLAGEIATDVFVYQKDEHPLGLITYSKQENKVVIGLIAVDATMKGTGIAQKLISTFLCQFPVETTIEVATQKQNLRACRFYERQGFKISTITHIYHLWIR